MSRPPTRPQDPDARTTWDDDASLAGPARTVADDALRAVRDGGPARTARRVADHVDALGARFGGPAAPPFVVDPVPRVIAADAWTGLERGLLQRVRALDAFVADAHGPRHAVAEGIVPATLAEASGFLEPDLVGVPPTAAPRIGVAGLDVVRDHDGVFRVLEDNCRTPSGLAYAVAAREAVAAVLGCPDAVRPFADAVGPALRTALLAARPAGDGAVVLLSDGAGNSARWEHETLARLMGVRLVGPDDLRRRGTRIELRDTGEAVGALYRRTDEERLRVASGAPTVLGELLLPALRAGTVGLLNAFGTGVADDKAVLPHVPDLVRFHLGEEPVLPDVPVHDLEDPAVRGATLARAREIVLKPRDGHGGRGVVIGPRADPAELAEAVAAARAAPGAWIAQDLVRLSSHPTVVGDDVLPRHVDLRPFAVADGRGGWTLLPGGLTRVALAQGELVVNSSRGGGGKDTWVLR